jgi:hypothetical protein
MMNKVASDFLFKLILKDQKKNRKTPDGILHEKLLEEIRALGYKIDIPEQTRSIVDIRFVDIFKRYIGKFIDDSINDSYIRELGHKEYRFITPYCIQKFHEAPHTEKGFSTSCSKWVWGLTLCNIKDERYIDDYIKMIEDPDNVYDIDMIILLLSKLKVKKAIKIFIKYLDFDPNLDSDSGAGKYGLNNSIIEALGNYKDIELKPLIEPFLQAKDSYTRNKAKSAMKKIENYEKSRGRL